MPSAEGLEGIAAEVRVCVLCPLSKRRKNAVPGEGPSDAPVMVVGEAPGANEDQQGRPFVGSAGRNLEDLLSRAGLARSNVFITNVVKCRPPNNRDPLPAEISACSGFLDAQVDLVSPKVIVTLGNFATRYLLGTTEGITRLRGRVHPYRDGIVIVPTFHPSAGLRSGGAVIAEMRADLVRAKRALSG